MKDAGGHNGVLHQQILLLKVTTERAPRVSETARITVEKLSAGIEWWSCALASPRSRMFRPRCAPMPRRSDAIPPLLPSSSGARYRLPRCNRRCRFGRNGSTQGGYLNVLERSATTYSLQFRVQADRFSRLV